MFRRLCGLVFVGVLLGAPAFANAQNAEACRAMAATIAPRQAEIDEIKAVRDAAAAKVETSGANWEDAEIHRLVSPAFAKEADGARAAYEDARKVLARHEMALQATVTAFNEDTERFNKLCAGAN